VYLQKLGYRKDTTGISHNMSYPAGKPEISTTQVKRNDCLSCQKET
jgi:hypothetical protein